MSHLGRCRQEWSKTSQLDRRTLSEMKVTPCPAVRKLSFILAVQTQLLCFGKSAPAECSCGPWRGLGSPLALLGVWWGQRGGPA